MASAYERVNVHPGDQFEVTLPYSEVCMHLGLAGKVHRTMLLEGRVPMVQLLSDDALRPISGAITPGEAGLFWDGSYYFYQ